MNNFKKVFCLILFGGILTATPGMGQDQALQQLIRGKKFFWEAKFDESLQALKQVTAIEDAKREYLFEAYLYTGFVLLRQNAPGSEVRAVFTEAINLDPKRKLDEMVIPPDLTDSFYGVRNQLVGCLYIISEPDDVDIVGVEGDSILFDETTPILICDLVDKEYQLLLTEEGYEQQFIPLELTAGLTDTLFVTLTPTYAQKSGGKKGLKWIVRGGILATAGAVLYKTVIESSGEGGSAGEELPAPPARPAR